MNEYTKLALWVLAAGSLFAFMWRKGYLLSLNNYTEETREELRKCTWPTWGELKGATVVVILTTFGIAFYTVVIDSIVSWIIREIT